MPFDPRPDTDPPALLIAIGAPGPARLAALLEAGIARIVLAEPDPARIAEIEAASGGQDGLELIQAAIAAQPGPAELVRYNQPGLRSLRAPEPALRRLLPGLRERARIEVACLDVAGLAARLGDPADWAGRGPVHLAVDAPGEEAALLEALAEAGLLERFARIDLRCGRQGFFAGAQGVAGILGLLPGLGLSHLGGDEADPDWPVLHLAPSPLLADLRAAEAALAETRDALRAAEESGRAQAEEAARQQRSAEAELRMAQEDLAARDVALRKAQEDLAARDAALETAGADLAGMRDRLAARDSDLAEARSQAKKQAAALTAAETRGAEQLAQLKTRAGRIARLEEARDAVQAELVDARAAQEKALAAQAALAAERDAQSGRAEALEADLVARNRRVQALEGSLTAAQARIDDQSRSLQRSQDDLTVAMRMQGLLQADLRALQDRYLAADRTRRQQADLLQKLTPRLQQAAAQLQGLALARPAPPDSSVPLPSEVPDIGPDDEDDADIAAAESPKPRPRKTGTRKTAPASARKGKPRSGSAR